MQKQLVRSLFDGIAHRYDLLNHLFSGGVDMYWRGKAIARLRAAAPERILDVATGTGDFAIAAARLSPRAIVGVDIAGAMLEVGRAKVAARGLEGLITLREADAEQLPFGEGTFDAAIVAFGVRNFEHLEAGLAEMARVLRPGGRIVVLEFSRPRAFPFRQLYMAYFRGLMPLAGRIISGHPHAYAYLASSVMAFPEGDDFCAILTRAGFAGASAERLTGGIASVYTAQRTDGISRTTPPEETTMTDRTITVGHSPDPDDAFMFYGLSSGRVRLPGIRIEHVLQDIQTLNERAMRGELEVTAISAHAFAAVADTYRVMRTGASMGERYGPVLISRTCRTLDELRGRTVATPGPLTTATLLFRTFTEGIRHVDMPFDAIMAAVDRGEVDGGLLIHEGQITYASLGYHKVVDFGELWDDRTKGLPLPLGLDVVRKDLGEDLAHRLSDGLRESIAYGYAHQDESIPYALQWGRGIERSLGEKFVKMYVSALTIDMGEQGRRALEELYRAAHERGLIARVPDLVLY